MSSCGIGANNECDSILCFLCLCSSNLSSFFISCCISGMRNELMPCNLQLYTSKSKHKQNWVGLVRVDYYREWTIREVDY